MDVTFTIYRSGTIFHVPELNRRNGLEKDNKDISWEILSSETYQDNDGEIRTIYTMVALDHEAEQIESIEVEKINLALYEHTDV